MSYFPHEVADCLAGVETVNFMFDGLYIQPYQFDELAAAIRADQISVCGSSRLDADTVAAYDPRWNTILYRSDAKISLSDPFTASTFVHEGVHAINDMYGRRSISRIDNEASAYIAQWIYIGYLSPMPEYYLNKSPFNKLAQSLAMIKCLGSIFSAYTKGALMDLTNAPQLKEIRDILGSEAALYKEAVGKKSDDNAGIPEVGKITKMDTKTNTFTVQLDTNGLELKFTADSSTYYFDTNQDTMGAGMKDARFKVGAKVKVVREDPNGSSIVTAVYLKK